MPYPTTFQRQIYPFINGFTTGHLGLTDRFFQGAVGQLSPPQSTGVTFTTGGHFYLGESGHYYLGLTRFGKGIDRVLSAQYNRQFFS